MTDNNEDAKSNLLPEELGDSFLNFQQRSPRMQSPGNSEISPNSSGILPPSRVRWGEGRKRRFKYYQYSSESTKIISAKGELEGGEIDVPFELPSNTTESSFRPKFSFYRLWLYTGPGWLMSIAYLDPGNLESDLQAGAIGGYQLIWVLWWATVLGWLLQSLAARLGVVTGKHLAQICRYEYSKGMAIFLWLMTQLAIIGSDIQEVVGSAIAYQLLFGWKLYIGCLITALDAFIFLLLNSMGLRVLEAFFCTLIGVMAVCFIIEFAIGKPDMVEITKGWVFPLCDNSNIEQAVGMIGAVIMPHNLFLHSALVQTRKIKRTSIAAVRDGNFYNTIESGFTLFISFIINLCVVAVFAKGFYNNPKYDVSDIGLSDAGTLLGNEYGSFAKYVWAIGVLAAGQSSTMTGTFAGQYAMSGFLDLHWKPWQQTLMTRAISLIPALTVAILSANNFDNVDELLNVQQSVQLPFALLPLLFMNCNVRVMGEFVLGLKTRIFFYIASIMVIGINIYLIAQSLWSINMESKIKIILLTASLGIYIALCGWLCYDFYSSNKHNKKVTDLQQRLVDYDKEDSNENNDVDDIVIN